MACKICGGSCVAVCHGFEKKARQAGTTEKVKRAVVDNTPKQESTLKQFSDMILRNTPEASGTAREAPSGPALAGPSAPQGAGEAELSSRLTPSAREIELSPGESVTIVAGRDKLVVKLGTRRGRPEAGDVPAEPWKELGLSRRTYYRRKREGVL